MAVGNSKIDQLQVSNSSGTTILYDIDLPCDATPYIYSLHADSYLEVGNPTASSSPSGWRFYDNGGVTSSVIEIAADAGCQIRTDVIIQGDSYSEDYDLMVSGNVQAHYYYATSDFRLKENIEDTTLDYNQILDNLRIVDFNFKADADKKLNIGVIAQELQAILPEKYQKAIVYEREKGPEAGYLAVNESKLIYVALLALKDQKKQIAELNTKIDNLTKVINEK